MAVGGRPMKYNIFLLGILIVANQLKTMDYPKDIENQISQAAIISTTATLKTLIESQSLEEIISLRKNENAMYCAAIKFESKSDPQSVVGFAKKMSKHTKCPKKVLAKLMRDSIIAGVPIGVGTYWYMSQGALSSLCNTVVSDIGHAGTIIENAVFSTIDYLPGHFSQLLSEALDKQDLIIAQRMNDTLMPMTQTLLQSSVQLQQQIGSVLNITQAIPSITTTIISPAIYNILPPVIQNLITTTNELPPLLGNLTASITDLHMGIESLANQTAQVTPLVQSLITNTSHMVHNTSTVALLPLESLNNLTGVITNTTGQLSNVGQALCGALDLKIFYILPIVLVGVGVVYLVCACTSRAIETSHSCRSGNKKAQAIASLIEADYDDCRIKKE